MILYPLSDPQSLLSPAGCSLTCIRTASPIPPFFLLRRPPGCTLFPYTTLFRSAWRPSRACWRPPVCTITSRASPDSTTRAQRVRSEEHTSELQSQSNLVCRLLLEKKKSKYLTVGQRADGDRPPPVGDPHRR